MADDAPCNSYRVQFLQQPEVMATTRHDSPGRAPVAKAFKRWVVDNVDIGIFSSPEAISFFHHIVKVAGWSEGKSFFAPATRADVIALEVGNKGHDAPDYSAR